MDPHEFNRSYLYNFCKENMLPAKSNMSKDELVDMIYDFDLQYHDDFNLSNYRKQKSFINYCGNSDSNCCSTCTIL
jgi:hypothetical protein